MGDLLFEIQNKYEAVPETAVSLENIYYISRQCYIRLMSSHSRNVVLFEGTFTNFQSRMIDTNNLWCPQNLVD